MEGSSTNLIRLKHLVRSAGPTATTRLGTEDKHKKRHKLLNTRLSATAALPITPAAARDAKPEATPDGSLELFNDPLESSFLRTPVLPCTSSSGSSVSSVVNSKLLQTSSPHTWAQQPTASPFDIQLPRHTSPVRWAGSGSSFRPRPMSLSSTASPENESEGSHTEGHEGPAAIPQVNQLQGFVPNPESSRGNASTRVKSPDVLRSVFPNVLSEKGRQGSPSGQGNGTGGAFPTQSRATPRNANDHFDEDLIEQLFASGEEDSSHYVPPKAASIIWDDQEDDVTWIDGHKIPYVSTARQRQQKTLSRIDESQMSRAQTVALKRESVPSCPTPLGTLVCPPPFFRDLQVKLLMKAKIHKPNLEFFMSSNWKKNSPATSYAFLRARSRWLAQSLDYEQPLAMYLPLSMMTQTCTVRSGATRVALHSEFQLAAVVVNHTSLNIYHTHNLYKFCTIDVTQEIAKFDKVDCGPSPSIGFLSWHRHSFTLALSFGNCALIMYGDPQVDDRDSLQSQLEETPAYDRVSAKLIPFCNWKVGAVLKLAYRTSCLAWLGDCLVTSSPSRESIPRFPGVDEEDFEKFQRELTDHLMAFGTFHFWSATFISAEKSVVQVNSLSPKPKVFLMASELAKSQSSKFFDLYRFESIGQFPDFVWNSKACLSILIESSKVKTDPSGEKSKLEYEDLNDDEMEQNGRLYIRDLQSSPGNRYLGIWFRYEVLNNGFSQEDALSKIEALNENLNCNIYLIFKNPKSDETYTNTLKNEVKLKSSTLRNTEDLNLTLRRRSSDITRQVARRALERDAARRAHGSCAIRTKSCLRSSVGALFKKKGHRRVQSMNGSYRDVSKSSSSSSTSETDDAEPLPGKFDSSLRAARNMASTTSSTLWKQKLSFSPNVTRQNWSFYRKELVETWEVEGSFLDLRKIIYDKKIVEVPADFFCVTELSHTVPLLTYTWKDQPPAADDVFIPAAIVSLDLVGRLIIWEESSLDRTAHFEVTCSIQLNTLSARMTAVLGLQTNAGSIRTKIKRVPSMLGSETDLKAAGSMVRRKSSSFGHRHAVLDKFAVDDQHDIVTKQAYVNWWTAVFRRAVEYADPLKQLTRSASTVSLVFLDSHRARIGTAGAHVMRRYLWRQHYRQHLKVLEDQTRKHRSHIFQATGHSYHTEDADPRSLLKSHGLFTDRRAAIDFLFILLRGSSVSEHLEDEQTQSLTLLALKNLSSQPSTPTAAREFLKQQQLGIPSNVTLTAILSADTDTTTDLCDLAFSVVPSHYVPPANISAWGDPSRLQEALLLPPCVLLCLDIHGSLISLSIRPQVFIAANEAVSEGKYPQSPGGFQTTHANLQNLKPSGAAGGSSIFMVRYLTEIIRETYSPPTTVALYPVNRNLMIHPTRLVLQRQPVDCLSSVTIRESVAIEIEGVEGSVNVQFDQPDSEKARRSARSVPPFKGSQLDAYLLTKNKVFQTRHSDVTPAMDRSLALHEHESAAFWILKSRLPGLKGYKNNWQTFNKVYNTMRVLVPLEIPTTSSRFGKIKLPSLKTHSGECGFVPLRREIEALGIDSIGEIIAFTRPENVLNTRDEMQAAASNRYMRITDFKNVGSGSMPHHLANKIETNGYASMPLMALVPIPLTVFDAAFDIFIGVTATTRKMIAFALASDLMGRIVMSPISLFGKEVLNSLLTAIDTSFHPNTKAGDPGAGPDTSEVDSHVISIQVINSSHMENPDQGIYSRVRMILHLGVVVDGVEEEQVLITTLAVTKNESGSSDVPVSLVFEPNGLDVYLDFSKGSYLGLGPNTAYIIPDLPPNDSQIQSQAEPAILQNIEKGTHCQLINSCVRYCAKTGWNNHDLIATFPPLEEPIIHETPPKVKGQFLQFVAVPDNRTSLLIPVCAICSPSDKPGAQVMIPFFLGRIMILEEEQGATGIDKETSPSPTLESGADHCALQDSKFFIMAIEVSMRTLVVLTSNAGLYIFEFRASSATRYQSQLMAALQHGNDVVSRLQNEIAAVQPEDGYPIYPHLAVQRIQLSSCIERNWRSTLEITQRRQAEQVLQSVLSHAAKSNTGSCQDAAQASSSSSESDGERTTWFRKRSSASSRSGGGYASGSGGLKKIAHSFRFGSRKGERDSKLGLASGEEGCPEILLKVGSLHFAQWFALEHYYAAGSLMSFFEPAAGSMDRSPEILLVKWADTVVMPNPDFYNEELLIDCKVSQLAHPTTHSWRPMSCVRPIIVSQVPVWDKGENDVGENTYRQGPELSGYKWVSQTWVPPTDAASGDPVVHGIEWNRKKSMLAKMGGGTITGVPVIVSYSSPCDLADMRVACCDAPIPEVTGKLILKARGAATKSIYHPDMLWAWLKCGSVKIVLRILYHLWHFFENPTRLPLVAGSLGLSALKQKDENVFPALAYLLDFKKAERNMDFGSTARPAMFLNRFGPQPANKQTRLIDGAARAQDLFADADFTISDSSSDTEQSPTKTLKFSSSVYHASAPRELSHQDSILHSDGGSDGSNIEPVAAEPSEDTRTGGGGATGRQCSAALELHPYQMVSQQQIEKIFSCLEAIVDLLITADTGVVSPPPSQAFGLTEAFSDMSGGGEDTYPPGWPLALTMNMEEVDRLLGLVDFLRVTHLADIVECSPDVASEWEWLYEALYSMAPTDGPEDFIPEVQFLMSIARQSFGTGKISHQEKFVSTDDLCWGLLVEAQASLLRRSVEIASRFEKDVTCVSWTWKQLAAVGAGFWVYERNVLDELIQRVPKDVYAEELKIKREQMKAGLLGTMDENKVEEMVLEQVGFWYCLTGKQGVLCAMFRKCKNETVANFLASDFTLERWRVAAVKNAWQLVSQKRYIFSLAFFILGKSGKEAVDICIRYLEDAQLATILSRLYDVYVEPNVEESNSVLQYLLTKKLIPLAVETQDVSLMLFSQTIAVSRNHPRRVLLQSTIQTDSTRTGYSALERGNMPPDKVATVTQYEPGPSPPQTNGTILGSNVVLRRYGAFARCPNILAFFFSANSSFLRRLDFELFESTHRACMSALQRKQLHFGLSLLTFLTTRMPQYVDFIPLKAYRMILAQWTMLTRSRAEFPISSDLSSACDPWLKVVSSTEQATDVLASLKTELHCCPSLMSRFELFVKVAPTCPTLPSLGYGVQSWEKLFESKADFHWVQYLMPYVPLHYVASIVKASLQEDKIQAMSSFKGSPRRLAIRRDICPLLGGQFKNGLVDWKFISEFCGAMAFGSIIEKQQLNSASLGMQANAIIIWLIQKVEKILSLSWVDLSSEFIIVFHIVHEMISTVLFHPCLLEVEYLRMNPEVVWTLLLGLITTSLALGLMTFDTLCGCLRGTVRTLDHMFTNEPSESAYTTGILIKGLLKIQTLWAAVLPSHQMETVQAEIVQSTSITLLLTFLQMFLFPGIRSSCSTPTPRTQLSAAGTMSNSQFLTVPPPLESSALPPEGDTPGLSSPSQTPTPPERAASRGVQFTEEVSEHADNMDNILKDDPSLQAQLLAISSDILCVAYCEAMLRYLRSLHFFRYRNKDGHKESPSLVAQFRWIERRLTVFTVHTLAERVETEVVAFFSTLDPLQMTTIFQNFYRWDVVISKSLHCGNLAHLWSAMDPSPKLKLFFLRGLTSHCQPCGWGIASLPPYRLSEAAPLLISAFQSLEGTAKFHLVHGKQQQPIDPAKRTQSSDVLPSPKLSADASTTAFYCPVSMVLLNMQVPVLRGAPFHMLIPNMGPPGVASTVWTQRSFATLLSIATTRGVRELPFHSQFVQLCDPVECLSIRNKEDSFFTFGHMILSSITCAWQRTLESCRVSEGFQVGRKLRPGSSSEFIIKYWRFLLEVQTRRSIQKIYTEIRNSTFAEEVKPHGALPVSQGPQPHDAQYLYLAPHPYLPVVAGIIANPVPNTNQSSSPITPLVGLFAFDYVPNQRQATENTPRQPHFVSLGRFGLPSSHEKGRVLISSKLRSMLSSESKLDTAKSSEALSKQDLSTSATGSAGISTDRAPAPSVASDHAAISTSMPCPLSAVEAGELLNIQWSDAGDLLLAATDNGWVLGWRVWTEDTDALHRAKFVTNLPQMDHLNVVVSNGFPSLLFKAHASGRHAIPIPRDGNAPLMATSGKGLSQGLQAIMGLSQPPQVPAPEELQALIFSENDETLASPSMSKIDEGQYLKAVSEVSDSFIEIIKTLDASSGCLCVWDSCRQSTRSTDHSVMRPMLIYGDFAFSRSDHPTDLVFWPAQNSVIYGTREGVIRSLSLKTGRIFFLAKIKKEEPRDTPQESQKLLKQRLRSQNWIRQLYLCGLTNRLIVVTENCNVFVYDLADTVTEEPVDDVQDSRSGTVKLLREIKASATHSTPDITNGSKGVAGVVDTLGNLLTTMTGKQGDVPITNYLSSVFIRPCHLVILTSNGRLIKVRL